MSHEQRAAALGLQVPAGIRAAAHYAPGVVRGGLLVISGQIPREGDTVRCVGKVGATVSLEEARAAARICALRLLGVARDMLGSLDRVEQVMELTVYVHATPDFTQPSQVADAASDLMVEVFGEAGRHARTAVCVAQLPQGAAVEIAALMAWRPSADAAASGPLP